MTRVERTENNIATLEQEMSHVIYTLLENLPFYGASREGHQPESPLMGPLEATSKAHGKMSFTTYVKCE